MRHAVLGAGGVGGLVGGALANVGHPVTLLVRSGRRDYYPERLTIESNTLGNFEVPVRIADRLDGQFDVVWITVKATALEAALGAVPKEELGSGVVVPLLNGVDHVTRLRERYGPEGVLPGIIRVEAERVEPGRVRQLSSFANVEVAPSLATRERAEALCSELVAAGLSCEVSDDEATMLWGKLCFLAPFALATTALGDTLGAVRSNPGWSTRLEASVEEACAVGLAEGAEVAPEPILAALEGAPDSFRSSMRRDVAAGRAPELDAIAGPILRGGSEHGIEVPAIRALVDHIVRAR
jgi:2-dehydropantoate 2-reductase